MQIRPWLTRAEEKPAAQLKIQDQRMWGLFDRRILHVRLKMQFHPYPGKMRVFEQSL